MKNIHVHKFGTNLLTNEHGINSQAIKDYAAGLIKTYGNDQIIVITSGAAAAGKQLAHKAQEPGKTPDLSLQQHAAMGQATVFRAWEAAFAEHNILAASTAVTHRQLEGTDPIEKKTFASFIHDNGDSGVVTIINEADTLSVKELMMLYTGGENDGLAAHTAWAYGAQSLYLWKEKGGFFDDHEQLVAVVNKNNIEAVRATAAAREKSHQGKGGISAGVEAAWAAASHGVGLVQIAATTPDMVGKDITRFVAR